jgi:hypothetical protein
MRCDAGATFLLVITWTDAAGSLVNLTGYTGQMSIKTPKGSLILSLTTSNGRITLGGTAGTITLTIADTDTAALAPGQYVYDLLLTSAANVATRLLEGSFFISQAVTP